MGSDQLPSALHGRLDARSSAQWRDELARDIVSAALVRGHFELEGGTRTDYFIDKYLFAARPAILRRVAVAFADLLPTGTQRLASHEIGPLAIAAALALETGLPLTVAHERDAGQPQPTDQRHREGDLHLSGELHPGDACVVVEDVVSSGRRARSLVEPLLAKRILVTDVLAVIDRDEGGAASIRATGARFHALYRLADLHV